MTFDAETVVAWAELPTAELRVNAQRLAAARLPAQHPLWTVIRERPALAAKLRSAFSGLLVTIKGSRDEHMQRLWITAARNAIDAKTAPEQKPVAERQPAAAKAQAPVVAASTSAAPKTEQPVVAAPARPAPQPEVRHVPVQQPQFAPPPPATPSRSAAPIPQVVFQEP
ncbi:hypothetical protein M8C13_23895 [Crossiella sp. SN42]|uniref:hypothetical protein n=1 Tax=Crossiella sp. SN42 TaxID=2944808 RepID=UPI00207D365A|nr:hypothetical protein [Crossiella sp. SN42]MCO1578801.1 hypothetical protein [Crossiella sp. SN42]